LQAIPNIVLHTKPQTYVNTYVYVHTSSSSSSSSAVELPFFATCILLRAEVFCEDRAIVCMRERERERERECVCVCERDTETQREWVGKMSGLGAVVEEEDASELKLGDGRLEFCVLASSFMLSVICIFRF